MANIAPRPRAELGEFEEFFQMIEHKAGYLPNAYLTLARHPALLRGWIEFSTAMQQLDTVDAGLKVLMSHLASSATGCRFCEAHTSKTAITNGVDAAKVAAVWEFETSPLFNDAERVALRVALAMAQVPNAVTAAHFDDLRRYYDEDQIVEMLVVVCSFGFWNRWNDTMATDLEHPVVAVASALLGGRGWTPGKHTVETGSAPAT